MKLVDGGVNRLLSNYYVLGTEYLTVLADGSLMIQINESN